MAKRSCERPWDFRHCASRMAGGFSYRNLESSGCRKNVSYQRDDGSADATHTRHVSDSEPDWFLQEWMRYREKRQADLVKELGWAKGRANKFYHGQHPYRRDIVNELSTWLEIEPFELLMEPERAIRIRRLTAAVLEIAGKD